MQSCCLIVNYNFTFLFGTNLDANPTWHGGDEFNARNSLVQPVDLEQTLLKCLIAM